MKKIINKIFESNLCTNLFLVAVGVVGFLIAAIFPIISTAATNNSDNNTFYDCEVVDKIYLDHGGCYIVVDDEDFAGVIQTEYWQYKICEVGGTVSGKKDGDKIEITSIMPKPETHKETIVTYGGKSN